MPLSCLISAYIFISFVLSPGGWLVLFVLFLSRNYGVYYCSFYRSTQEKFPHTCPPDLITCITLRKTVIYPYITLHFSRAIQFQILIPKWCTEYSERQQQIGTCEIYPSSKFTEYSRKGSKGNTILPKQIIILDKPMEAVCDAKVHWLLKEEILKEKSLQWPFLLLFRQISFFG